MTTTRRDHSTPTPNDAGPVDRMLVELLDLPIAQRASALQRLVAQHPAHADELRRRWQWLEGFGLVDQPAEEEGTFGPFRLLRRLGGATADVHLVEDTRNGAEVVLKRLQQPHLLADDARNSLRIEAMAASRLSHPSIGIVLEFAEHEGVPYLVRPFLGETTLREWIAQRRSRGQPLGNGDQHLVLDWIAQIARALHAAHGCGLVHRDVKPDNIVLQTPGPPVLIDFGLCQEQVLQSDGTPSPAAGTLPYMAPELLSSHDGRRGPAADIYALGVTLLEAMTLRQPFQADSPQAVCRRILAGDHGTTRSRMRDLPVGLRRVIDCAMAREAWERYGTAEAFADDLERLRQGQPPRAPGTSKVARARRWARRNRFVTALAGMGTALLALLGWLEWQHSQFVLAASDGRYLLFADRLRTATAEADRLVPGWPEQAPALRAWLHDAQTLLREQRGWPAPPANGAQGVADAALRAAIAQATRVQAEFTAPRGPLAMVQQRLDWAERVQQVSIDDHRERWSETIEAIAASERYGGLRIRPQYDLVPLGADRSGLFEFLHLPSGLPNAPAVERRRTDRKLELHDFAGLVLVLIPGGTFTMGQQAADPAAPRYDPLAPIYDTPHQVTVEPFFLSKFEMTQQQWKQLTGDAPSYPLRDLLGSGHRYPVNQVNAEECDLVLQRVGLVLPTEAQWEWAAGLGAPTLFYFGNDPALLPQHGNLALDDAFPTLAPVGMFPPNPAGLHDLYGNVAEWCRDAWMDYRSGTPRSGDGLRVSSTAGHYHRTYRGGSYRHPDSVRTSVRFDEPSARRSPFLGLRPARALQLEEGR